MLLLAESLFRGWIYCRNSRSNFKGLPPALPLSLLGKAIGSWSNPPTIQGCFDAAELWFSKRKDRTWSLELFPGLCLRRFVLVANEELLTHILVSKNSRYTKHHATEVLLEVLFTGASSVTTTLLWLLWHLATHPEAQTRVLEELQTSNHQDILSAGSSLKLPFLDACIRETLRLYSPIHVGRSCIQDDEFQGIDIPKGTDVASNMWFIHRDSAHWEDPHEFRPVRFLGKPTNLPYYHPFSMGLRGCPGRAIAFSMIKYVVARVIVRFEVSPAPGLPTPQFDGSVVLSNTPTGVYLKSNRRSL